MKKPYLTIVLLLVVSYSHAQIVDIPDANFKDALVNSPVADIGNSVYEDVDTNDDGEIQVNEAEAVLILFVSEKNIASLEGIQSFINIEYLQCSSNQLENLNITQNHNIEILRCNYNLLTSLDLSQNQNLTELYCSNNNLSSLDISQNINLEEIWCNYNDLISLNINYNLNLIRLFCVGNDITSINVSENMDLQVLSAGSNDISSLDLSQNLNLIGLGCGFNLLTSLDLSINSNLEELGCWGNDLMYLNIANGNNNMMEHMDSRSNPNLTCIQVDDENATYPICDDNNYTGWCLDEWTEYSDFCVLGTEDNELSSQFDVYPNPVNDLLTIGNTSTSQITSIKLYDPLGRLVVTEKGDVKRIDVSSLNSGLLFLKIETDEGVLTRKIIKE